MSSTEDDTFRILTRSYYEEVYKLYTELLRRDIIGLNGEYDKENRIKMLKEHGWTHDEFMNEMSERAINRVGERPVRP